MLTPRKKLSRKEIKEDTLVTLFVKAQKFYQKYARQTHIGVIVVLAAAVIAVVMVRSKAKADQAAAGQIGIAEQYYLAGEHERAMNDLNQIVNTYAGTRSAGKAVFYIANIYYQQQDYTNAQKYYRIYVDEYGSVPLFRAASFSGIGACLEEQKDYAQAGEYYEKAAEVSRNTFYAPFYLKDAGRCYELAGLNDKGREVYQSIVDSYPDSSVKTEAEFRLKSL